MGKEFHIQYVSIVSISVVFCSSSKHAPAPNCHDEGVAESNRRRPGKAGVIMTGATTAGFLNNHKNLATKTRRSNTNSKAKRDKWTSKGRRHKRYTQAEKSGAEKKQVATAGKEKITRVK